MQTTCFFLASLDRDRDDYAIADEALARFIGYAANYCDSAFYWSLEGIRLNDNHGISSNPWFDRIYPGWLGCWHLAHQAVALDMSRCFPNVNQQHVWAQRLKRHDVSSAYIAEMIHRDVPPWIQCQGLPDHHLAEAFERFRLAESSQRRPFTPELCSPAGYRAFDLCQGTDPNAIFAVAIEI